MKVEVENNAASKKADDGHHHSWISISCLVVGFGVLVLALFLIRKCRQSSQSKHEYSAVKTDGGNEKFKGETRIRNSAYLACKRNLDNNERYELRGQLGDIGFRANKNWFTVHDKTLGADRLLTLVPLPSTCPIIPCPETRETLVELFRGLQHPYILPVLDVEFWKDGAVIISPLNPTGSLKDLIYGSFWQDDYERKYITKGEGLPLRTVQCLGRQIIEALLFLRNRQFPPIYHLHSGNVIIQNGVARLAGLENPLFGILPKAPAAPETLAFGYLLFEMTAGYELPGPPSPAHLQLELERASKVADALEFIFQSTGTPSLEELIRCDLFRGVELRELRGASILQIASPPEVLQLLDVVRNPSLPSPLLRRGPKKQKKISYSNQTNVQILPQTALSQTKQTPLSTPACHPVNLLLNLPTYISRCCILCHILCVCHSEPAGLPTCKLIIQPIGLQYLY